MKKINKYLSKMTQDITPYEWEEGFTDDSLRFDTNTLSCPPRCLPDFLKEMEKDCPVNEYIGPSYKKLKILIADYEGVREDMITVANSGDEAIDILAKTFLNPEDYFIVTPPTYEMFQIQCEINRGKPLQVALLKETFAVDSEKIVKKSKDLKVKLIFLVSPNNPTGTVISLKDIEKILERASAIVVVDEVYREFYGKTVLPLLGKYENLVVLRSFSKFAGIAGARVGYLVAKKSISKIFGNVRFPMGVSYLSYKLAEMVLRKDRKWIRRQVAVIRKERSRLTKAFLEMGFYVVPSQANFLLVRLGKRARKIYKQLKRRKIIIRDCSNKKYLEGYARITVRSRAENTQLLKAVEEVSYEI